MYYNPVVRLTRRSLIQSISFAALSLPFPAPAQTAPANPLKIVVAGAHPGDPECGCGGTIARYTALGHHVTILYLNRGQGYCQGGPPASCGDIRTREAEKACGILKATPAFLSQVDGQAVVDAAHYAEVAQWFDVHQPDIIFTQWPIDSHRDHRAIASLVLDAWLRHKTAALLYYEVAEDTLMFTPTHTVDVSSVETLRHDACFAHTSQSPTKWYPAQVEITQRHGRRIGVAQAEAFHLQDGSPKPFLPV